MLPGGPLNLLDFTADLGFFLTRFRCSARNLKGNSVRIGDGPAAVTGDDRCILSLILSREGAASRMNRESEDLPEP